jgi:hypothetical protein
MCVVAELFAEIAVGHVLANPKRIPNDCRRNGRDQADCAQIRKEEGRIRSCTNDGKAQDRNSDREDGHGLARAAVAQIGVCVMM